MYNLASLQIHREDFLINRIGNDILLILMRKIFLNLRKKTGSFIYFSTADPKLIKPNKAKTSESMPSYYSKHMP